MTSMNHNDYDRQKELQEFENTKLGVKGLIDSGITHVPRIFHHPLENLEDIGLQKDSVSNVEHNLIPVIDMSLPRSEVVQQMKKASSEFGFFQVINHGISVSLLDSLVKSMRAFHELPSEEKMRWYNRDFANSKVRFYSNPDLFYSKAACWRDTLLCVLGFGLHEFIDPDLVPIVCRKAAEEHEKEAKQFADRLIELLSEGLGLASDRLKGPSYLGRITMSANYYPHCPEPTKTIGISPHRDIGMFTVLVQDQVGGLQVKCNGKWINLKPVHGALVINIGDVFQMLSNDVYKSGEHRVVANPLSEARGSVAVFFHPGCPENVYGPLPELVSDEKPALYRQFKFSEINNRLFTKELSGTMVDIFRLE